MNGLLERLNLFFENAPSLLLPWRWTVLSGFFLITAIMTYGLYSKFAMDMSLESWFNDDDPVKLQLDDFRQQFGSDDGIYMVYRAKDGDVFSLESAQLLAKLHTELDTLSREVKSDSLLTRIERIDSLYNVRYQSAQGDDLLSNKLLSHDFPATQAEMENRRRVALAQPGFELAYYSKDFRFGGVRIKTNFGTEPVSRETQSSSGNLLTGDLLENDLLVEDDFIQSAGQSSEFKAEKIDKDYEWYWRIFEDKKIQKNYMTTKDHKESMRWIAKKEKERLELEERKREKSVVIKLPKRKSEDKRQYKFSTN